MHPVVLFIAPLPPPITGQAVASEAVIKNLKQQFNFFIIDYARKDGIKKSKLAYLYIQNVLLCGLRIRRYAKKADTIYLTISQSLLGNIKDLFFLWMMGRARSKLIVHLHGGGFLNYFYKAPFIVKLLNKALFKNIAQGIVLGKSLKKELQPLLIESKIQVVHNFYHEEIRIEEKVLISKWEHIKKLNIVYLSNLMEQKGYLELLTAFLALPVDYQQKVKFCFAGEFEIPEKKDSFLEKIKNNNQVSYVGVVKGKEKISLLQNAHAFFLPTYYEIEGQPISILEAYAAGTVVFTTDQGGISDIFISGKNGKLLEKRSVLSIKEALVNLIENKYDYKNLAYYNWKYAQNFNEQDYVSNIKRLFLRK